MIFDSHLQAAFQGGMVDLLKLIVLSIDHGHCIVCKDEVASLDIRFLGVNLPDTYTHAPGEEDFFSEQSLVACFVALDVAFAQQ